MENLTREETLYALRSIGIDLPLSTKLPDDNLNKRLRDALDAAQYKSDLPSSLDLNALKTWPLAVPEAFQQRGKAKGGKAKGSSSGRLLLEAVKRGNMMEAVQNVGVPDLYADPFTDLRQTIMGMANFLDNGATTCLIQDSQQQECAINVRVVSVLEITEDIPAIVVLYHPFTRESVHEGIEWVREQRDTRGALSQIHATPIEQKLLLKLLKNNASLVPPDLAVDRKPTEVNYRLSVLLPIGPLEFEDIASLNKIVGCSVCGKKEASKCSQCLTVTYCSKECQVAHWPEHKKTCKSLKGGRWVTLKVRPALPGMEQLHMVNLNKYSTVHSLKRKDDTRKRGEDPPPPDVWGGRVFGVKFQVGLGGSMPTNMMMYDRKRSFQVFATLEDNGAVFLDCVEEVMGPRGGFGGVKMYRWVRRTGDWEFSVCLDRETTDTKW